MNNLTAPAHSLHNMVTTLKQAVQKKLQAFHSNEKSSVEAYNIWAETYDAQSGNLMLDLDAEVFGELLASLDIWNKQVADVGCGTGRHWPLILNANPANITGFDVSAGMLSRLEKKFPKAKTYQIVDNSFSDIRNGTYDAIISTLTVAHIKNLNSVFTAWSRILKHQSDIIITDFHPEALASGGKRTFKHHNASISIKNFVHRLNDIEHALAGQGFRVVSAMERTVGDSVKHYYEAQNALDVYERFKDKRIIYGLHFRRGK